MKQLKVTTAIAIALLFILGVSLYVEHKRNIKIKREIDSLRKEKIITDSVDRAWIDTVDYSYCREIDSMLYSLGIEVDADRFDIDSVQSMESAGVYYLGDKFYAWRQEKSIWAWEYDVYIARWCY